MIFPALFERRATVLSAGHPENFLSWMAAGDTFAGVSITPYNALQVAAVYAAVRILSESMAVLSIDLYKRLDDGGKKRERDHEASWLVREEPNRETSAFIFRELGQGHLCTWGNFYSEIQRTNKGRPIQMVQRRPDRVEPERDASGDLAYRVQYDDGTEAVKKRLEMLHVPGLSFNGYRGFSPIEMLRGTVGRSMAVGRYRASFFGNRMQWGGILKSPKVLTREAKEAALDALEKLHKGPENAFRGLVLDQEMDWQSVGLPNDAAQMLETSTFEVQEIARVYRIPPHMLAELSHGTFTNIEHQSLSFIKDTMLPWMKRWETEFNRKLLSDAERRAGLFFEFNADTLLRGDFDSRMKGFATGIQWGITSPNEARARENLNPYEGGDEYLVPLNMQSISRLGERQPTRVTEEVEPDGTRRTSVEFEQRRERNQAPDLEARSRRSVEARWRLRDAFERLIAEAAGRLVAAEVKAIRAAVAKMPDTGEAAFRQWLEEFFRQHGDYARSAMGPILLSYMEAVAAEALEELGADPADFEAELEDFHAKYVEAFTKRYTGRGYGQIRQILDDAESEAEAVAEVLARLDGWEETSAAKIGLSESTQALGAISMMAYAAAGVTLLRWVWNGGDCEICPHMDGKVVEIGRPFLAPGDKVGDEGASIYEVQFVRNHPPLHRGCICTVAPEIV